MLIRRQPIFHESQFGMMKQTLLFCIILASVFSGKAFSDEKKCSSVVYPAPSGFQNNITFKFDRAYRCGQFANGDWWVSVDTSNSVNIISITPLGKNGFNGSEINPISKVKQGFDKRVGSYDESLKLSSPVKVKGGSTVIKVVSVKEGKKKCRPCIQFAAALTITDKSIENSESVFRPGYYGDKKVFYQTKNIKNKVQVKYSKFLTPFSIGKMASKYGGIRLDHKEGWTGEFLHPIDNMPSYGAAIATNNAEVILRLLADDFDYERPAHRSVLIDYVQMGIDLKSMADMGVDWPANGGHGNGRKLPLLLAGWFLGESTFYDTAKKTVFSEDKQVYISSITSLALYGAKCSDKGYWRKEMFGNGDRTCRDPYGYIDGGGQEIGQAYQFCCTAMPWKYTVLVLRLLGTEDIWHKDAFFEYVDRWVNKGVWAKPDNCAPYSGRNDEYGMTFGPLNGKCIKGSGRYLSKHGLYKDGGYYRSKLGDKVWSRVKWDKQEK